MLRHMDRSDLQAYLHEHIPLTHAMGLSVVEASERRVVLAAPLGPNLNHRHTAFGGSISTLATVAAWSWLYLDAMSFDFDVRLVIRSNRVEYLAPIEGDFLAIAEAPAPEEYDAYRQALRRRGKGRLELGARVEFGEVIAATFVGSFVAIRPDAP